VLKLDTALEVGEVVDVPLPVCAALVRRLWGPRNLALFKELVHDLDVAGGGGRGDGVGVGPLRELFHAEDELRVEGWHHSVRFVAGKGKDSVGGHLVPDIRTPVNLRVNSHSPAEGGERVEYGQDRKGLDNLRETPRIISSGQLQDVPGRHSPRLVGEEGVYLGQFPDFCWRELEALKPLGVTTTLEELDLLVEYQVFGVVPACTLEPEGEGGRKRSARTNTNKQTNKQTNKMK